MNPLTKIDVTLKSGKEPFSFAERDLNFKLLDFWQWSQSDLLNNSLRGVLAEYIVKQDLGIENTPRTEWDAFDLITKEGIKIEVKSSAYLQSWTQKKLSSISFNISPTMGWDANKNEYSTETKRQSDFYIFCLLNPKDKKTVNPLKLEQWTFFILSTKILDREKTTQKTITLKSLLKLNPAQCSFGNIKNLITH